MIEPDHKEYVGKIPELQGKMALVRKANGGDFPLHTLDYSKLVMAQFDDPVVYGERMMHVGWHPFPADDFSTVKSGKKVF